MTETAIITRPDQHPARADVLNRLQQLRISYLATLSPHTRRAYNRDLRDFADFLGEEEPTDALRRLIERGQGEANSLTLQYKAHLIEQEKTPATINRRLSSLRSAVKLA
ncbi:MAG: site-specific integrase, partial [Candidatus Auribacterota bacterium]|nr:site-specific integrase [Candidatus Auribacterota bacterium]